MMFLNLYLQSETFAVILDYEAFKLILFMLVFNAFMLTVLFHRFKSVVKWYYVMIYTTFQQILIKFVMLGQHDARF